MVVSSGDTGAPLRPLHLALGVAADDAATVARATALAARRAMAFVLIDLGRLDPVLVAAHVGPQAGGVGLLPAVSTALSEPFLVSSAIATLDVATRGQGGWLAVVEDPRAQGRPVSWALPEDPVADAREHVEVVRALWDSWEDGAEIRDARTHRFIDRDRVHRIDVRGEHLSVRGPSITPRPPQGQPVVAAREPGLAGEVDLLLVADAEGLDAARDPRPPLVMLELDAREAAADPQRLVELHRAGLDGVVLGGDLAVAESVASVLAHHGAPRAATLRARLGLPRAVNRYAPASP